MGAALLENYVLSRQRLQVKADVAAEHGAAAFAEGRNVEEAVRRRLARFGAVEPGRLVRIERPPADGRFQARPRAVRVHIRSPWSPPLVPSRLVGGIAIEARATAVSIPASESHPAATLRVE